MVPDEAYLTIVTKYSHHFTVVNPSRRIMPLLYKLASKYTQFGMQYNPRTRRQVWGPVKTYALYIEKGYEFRFHINQFPELIQSFEQNFIDKSTYSIEIAEPVNAAKVELKVKPSWVLREEQEEARQFVVDEGCENHNSPLLMMPTGTGKASPLTTPVKIPGGWTAMGLLKLEDYITAWDGTPAKVIGIFPQGHRPVYRITFEDGRQTECDLQHLWRVTTSEKRAWTKVINTLEIARLLKLNTYRDRLYIDLPSAEDCPDKILPVDPYTLGLILGDGCISQRVVEFTTPDQELVEHFRKTIPNDHRIKRITKYNYGIRNNSPTNQNFFIRAFKKLGLQGKRSWEKFIPTEYFYTSRSQRLSLVQGLLDTDGTVDRKNGTVSFTSTSKVLAEGMQYLIRSLGGLAKITTRFTQYTWKDEKRTGRLAYTVFIRHKKPSELFRLGRQKKRTNDINQYAATLKLRIKSVEYAGHKEVQCIMIDHPDHLYVVNDFIVTHNTVTSLVATADLGYRFAVVLLAQYVDKWISDIKQVMEIEDHEIGIIQGSDSLVRSTYYPSSGLEIPKAFVISLSTMARWYSLYEENRNHPSLEKYECLPGEFFQHLGIGTVLFDEVHQHPYAVFRLFCYTHTIKTIELSATLLAKDQSLQRVQHMMFPRNKRFDKIQMKRYINAYACAYQISEFHRSKILTMEHGRNTYSQAAYEKSILRHKTIKPQYIEMLLNMVRELYVKPYIEGDKLALFVGTAKMAKTLVEAIQKYWPEYDTRTYLEGDDYENVIKPDIRVTTVLSGGTAVDIPNLRVAILTIAVDSPISNIQVLGRLRELKDRDVHFYYLYCTSIQKHMDYHERKMELFKMRVAKMNQMYVGTLKP